MEVARHESTAKSCGEANLDVSPVANTNNKVPVLIPGCSGAVAGLTISAVSRSSSADCSR